MVASHSHWVWVTEGNLPPLHSRRCCMDLQAAPTHLCEWIKPALRSCSSCIHTIVQRQRLREKRDEKMRSQSHAATGGALSEAELAVARRSAAVAAEELLRQEEEEAARAASRRAAKARKKKGVAAWPPFPCSPGRG